MAGNGVTEELATQGIVCLLHRDEGLDFECYPLVCLVVEVNKVWGIMGRLFVYNFLDNMTGAWLFLLGCQVLLIILLDVGKLWDDKKMPAAALEMADETSADEVSEPF